MAELEKFDRLAKYENEKRERTLREAEQIKKYELAKARSKDGRTIDDVIIEVMEAQQNEYRNRPGGVRGDSDTGLIKAIEEKIEATNPLINRISEVMTKEEHDKYCQIEDKEERRAYFYSFKSRLKNEK